MDFDSMEKDARQRHIPIILGDSLAELITLIDRVKPKRILEIGTAIGYSGSIMLSHSEGSILDTVELMPERREEALRNFRSLGYEGRVNSYLGDAAELLPEIMDGNMYDLVFIDGPKSKYGAYLDAVLPHVTAGGYIFCDNVLFRGMVRSDEKPPHKFRTIVCNLRLFIDRITSDSRLDTVIMEKGDGIAVIKVIK